MITAIVTILFVVMAISLYRYHTLYQELNNKYLFKLNSLREKDKKLLEKDQEVIRAAEIADKRYDSLDESFLTFLKRVDEGVTNGYLGHRGVLYRVEAMNVDSYKGPQLAVDNTK